MLVRGGAAAEVPVFGVLIFLVTLVVGTLVGIPLATRLARVHVWKRTALPEMPGDREVYRRVRFEPVDFGEDNMQWPSEVSREQHGIPERPWPSEGWDDPHFGKGAKESRERAAEIAAVREKGRVERVEQRAAETAQRNQAKRAADPPTRRPQRSPQERVQKSKKRSAQKTRRPRPAPRVQQAQESMDDEWFDETPARPAQPAQPAKPPARKPAPAAKKAAPARESSGGDGLPDRATVERMVAEMGLAGAVQQLMRTQGWDFKTAAAWLGRVRRG